MDLGFEVGAPVAALGYVSPVELAEVPDVQMLDN